MTDLRADPLSNSSFLHHIFIQASTDYLWAELRVGEAKFVLTDIPAGVHRLDFFDNGENGSLNIPAFALHEGTPLQISFLATSGLPPGPTVYPVWKFATPEQRLQYGEDVIFLPIRIANTRKVPKALITSRPQDVSQGFNNLLRVVSGTISLVYIPPV